MSGRRTDSAAPEALWLFRDTQHGEPAPAPAKPRAKPDKTDKGKPGKPGARKGPRKPRAPSRDLFTAVAGAFARSSEAARAEIAAEPLPVPQARPESAVPRTRSRQLSAPGPADAPVPWDTEPADSAHWPDHDIDLERALDEHDAHRAESPWSPGGELEIALLPGGAREQVLALLREAEDVASNKIEGLEDRRLDGGAELQHVSILASAGSGKTYQLTNRYLQILARGAAPFSILASTFTRAAAGEIRDRILRTLAESADADDKRHELTRRLQRPGLSRQFVLDLLTSLAHNLHRLQIRTLDSFFGTIVRCFCLELGLPSDARIVDEDEAARLRRSAIQRMLEEGDEDAIIELLSSLTEGSSERAVTDTIDNTVSSLYDLYREARYTDAWQAIAPAVTLTEAALDHAIDRKSTRLNSSH